MHSQAARLPLRFQPGVWTVPNRGPDLAAPGENVPLPTAPPRDLAQVPKAVKRKLGVRTGTSGDQTPLVVSVARRRTPQSLALRRAKMIVQTADLFVWRDWLPRPDGQC
jgi:hypothetical protein